MHAEDEGHKTEIGAGAHMWNYFHKIGGCNKTV